MESAGWIPVEQNPPVATPLLIWSNGACAVAVVVEGTDESGPWQVFMDARSDEILPWPSHWMQLPHPPLEGERAMPAGLAG